MRKLKQRWGLTSNMQFMLVLTVFAISGTASARCAAPITEWLGLTTEGSSPWVYWPLRIVVVLPVYQVLLLAFGFLFGQFSFFWQFEKRMFAKLGFTRERASAR